MSCAIGFVRIILFIFNFLFCLCGLALLILGVLVETNLGSVKAETADQIHQIEVIAIGLIVIGSIIFVIAFFGCCGAIRESHCMTVTYAVFLLVILVIQVGIAIWAFVVLKNLNTAEMTEEFKKPLTKYWSDVDSRNAVDLAQEMLHCCGASGPDDYASNHVNMNGTIPWSCCKQESERKFQFCNGREVYQIGCSGQIKDLVKNIGHGLGGVALGIAGIELVGIIFALCLANSIRNEDRRNYRV